MEDGLLDYSGWSLLLVRPHNELQGELEVTKRAQLSQRPRNTVSVEILSRAAQLYKNHLERLVVRDGE